MKKIDPVGLAFSSATPSQTNQLNARGGCFNFLQSFKPLQRESDIDFHPLSLINNKAFFKKKQCIPGLSFGLY